jgi:hypothetical protein
MIQFFLCSFLKRTMVKKGGKVKRRPRATMVQKVNVKVNIGSSRGSGMMGSSHTFSQNPPQFYKTIREVPNPQPLGGNNPRHLLQGAGYSMGEAGRPEGLLQVKPDPNAPLSIKSNPDPVAPKQFYGNPASSSTLYDLNPPKLEPLDDSKDEAVHDPFEDFRATLPFGSDEPGDFKRVSEYTNYTPFPSQPASVDNFTQPRGVGRPPTGESVIIPSNPNRIPFTPSPYRLPLTPAGERARQAVLQPVAPPVFNPYEVSMREYNPETYQPTALKKGGMVRY